MIRTDIITTIGRQYLTSNIENEEFSYGKALKTIGKDYTQYLSDDAKRVYKDLDIVLKVTDTSSEEDIYKTVFAEITRQGTVDAVCYRLEELSFRELRYSYCSDVGRSERKRSCCKSYSSCH